MRRTEGGGGRSTARLAYQAIYNQNDLTETFYMQIILHSHPELVEPSPLESDIVDRGGHGERGLPKRERHLHAAITSSASFLGASCLVSMS